MTASRPLAAMVATLALAGAAAACSPSTPAAAPQVPEHVAIGGTIDIPAGHQADGFARVTVYSLQDPITTAPGGTAPETGDHLAAADVQVCAGRKGATTNDPTNLLPLPFQLDLAGTDSEGMLQDPSIRRPFIGNVAAQLEPYQCVRGWAPFEYRTGERVTAVGWGGPDDPVYTWAVAG